MKNKYGNKKVIRYGIKFDSTAEADYYPIAKKYAEENNLQLFLQHKIELIPTMKNENGTVRKTQYKADYAFLDQEWNIIRLVDVKGKETPVFTLKAKMTLHSYGIAIILAKKTRNGFYEFPFNTPKNKRPC